MGAVGMNMYLFFVIDSHTDNNAKLFILISYNCMTIVR